MRLLAHLATLSLATAEIPKFEKTTTVLWTETDTVVQTGVTQYQVEYVYTSPCNYFDNITDKNLTPILSKFKGKCLDTYKRDWLAKIDELVKTNNPPARQHKHSLAKREIVTLSVILTIVVVTNLISAALYFLHPDSPYHLKSQVDTLGRSVNELQ